MKLRHAKHKTHRSKTTKLHVPYIDVEKLVDRLKTMPPGPERTILKALAFPYLYSGAYPLVPRITKGPGVTRAVMQTGQVKYQMAELLLNKLFKDAEHDRTRSKEPRPDGAGSSTD